MPRPHKPDPKLAALQESGTVNPHAQDIEDPAFLGSDFFDPRDLVQARYEMLRRVRTEGLAIAEAAARFGVSRPTFYKAQSEFDRQGLIGLLPGKRGPRTAHKLTEEVMRFIEELRTTEGALSSPALVERIAERFGVVVHRRSVERALARPKKKTAMSAPLPQGWMRAHWPIATRACAKSWSSAAQVLTRCVAARR